MPMAKPSERETLELQNSALREQVGHLKAVVELKKQQLTNNLTGLAAGMMTQDNITSLIPLFQSNLYSPVTLNYTLLTYLYKTHGILQTMVDEPVLDSFREGFEYESQELSASNFGELEDYAEEHAIWESVKSTLQWGRLYGGSGLIINVGQDWERPFDEKDIKPGMFELYDANRWEFSGAMRSAKEFLFYGKKLDATRVLTFGGKRAPHLIRAQLSGWGMSELERAIEDFNMWLRGRNVLYEILDEAKVDVYSIKDYAQTLMTPDGEATIRRRVQATNSIKNFHNALILDKEDDYHVVANNFSGLSDVMKENRIGIASALRMPMTKIFGMSSAGFNAGDDDIENYNAMITAQVREPAKPLIRKVLRLLQLAVFGKVYDLGFKFKPLRVLGAAEEEALKTSKQTRYLALYQAQVIDSKELGELLHKDGLVMIKTKAQQGLLPSNPQVPSADAMFEQPDDQVGAPRDEEGTTPQKGDESLEEPQTSGQGTPNEGTEEVPPGTVGTPGASQPSAEEEEDKNAW